jgi:hypothetical protein
MNPDRDLDLLLDQWMAEGPTDDADRLKSEAMAKIAVTPQVRGSLLPWRVDMTAITRLAVVAILAASGTALFMTATETGPAEPVAPAAEADADAAVSQKAAAFTGTSSGGQQTEQGQEVAGEGKMSMLGDAWSVTLEDMSDPRLNGTLTLVANRDFHGLQGRIASLSLRIDNDLGSWLGSGHGWDGSIDSTPAEYGHALLRGTGAYEGLTALMYTTLDQDGALGPRDSRFQRYTGMVFPGGVPETPAMPEAPVE